MHITKALKSWSGSAVNPTVLCVVLYVTQSGHVLLIFNLIMNKIQLRSSTVSLLSNIVYNSGGTLLSNPLSENSVVN